MIQKIVLSLCVLALIHSTFIKAMAEESADLNACLLGVRDDMVDLDYISNLLEQGAQIDARDAAGKTALMKFAARSWWPECRLLIVHSRFYPKEELIKKAALSTEQKEETAITLAKEKMSKLASLMQEARDLAPDKDTKALLDPEKLAENFGTEIREVIREELGLKDSSWLAWLSTP